LKKDLEYVKVNMDKVKYYVELMKASVEKFQVRVVDFSLELMQASVEKSSVNCTKQMSSGYIKL
jgi:hypothetical protein